MKGLGDNRAQIRPSRAPMLVDRHDLGNNDLWLAAPQHDGYAAGLKNRVSGCRADRTRGISAHDDFHPPPVGTIWR